MSSTSLRRGLKAHVAGAFDSLAGRVDVFAARTRIAPSLVALAGAECAERERPAEMSGEDELFPTPEIPSLRLVRARVRSIGPSVDVWDARWDHDATTGADDLPAARLFLQGTPARSAVVLVHGYLGGHYATERWLWPMQRLLRAGHDVALVTLPEHGVRAPSAGPPRYPSRDPEATLRATRQAISELRGLLRFFRSRGAVVGACGASLGGYLVALLATVEAELSFAVPVVPLSDLTAFASGRVPDSPCRVEMLAKAPELVHAYDPVSPLVRRPSLPGDRMVVLGARGDRIAPLAHAKELALHFDCPLEIFSGGHWLQPSHSRLLRAIDQLSSASLRDHVPTGATPAVREVVSTSLPTDSRSSRFS